MSGEIMGFEMKEEQSSVEGGGIFYWWGGEGGKHVDFAYWNGSFVYVKDAVLHPLNQGSQYSHAFFEGQRFYRMDDGGWVAFRFPEHFARFIASFWAIKGYDSLSTIVETINTEGKNIIVETPSVEMLYEEASRCYISGRISGRVPIFIKIDAGDSVYAGKIGEKLMQNIPDVLVEDKIVKIPLVMCADEKSYDVYDLMELTKELFAINNLDMVDADSFYYRPYATITNSPLKLQTFGKEVVLGLFPLPWGPYLGKGEVDIVVVPWKRISPEQFKTFAKMAGHYTNSVLSANLARAFGFAEGIMLDMDGNIAEGSAMNLFIVKDNTVYTPPLGVGILPGITRDSVIKLLRFMDVKVVEKNLTLDDLLSAESAFFTGTAAEVMPLNSISVPKSFEKMKEYDELLSPSGKKMKINPLKFRKVKFNGDNKIPEIARNGFFDLFKPGSKTNNEFGEWLQQMPSGEEKIEFIKKARRGAKGPVSEAIRARIANQKNSQKAKVF